MIIITTIIYLAFIDAKRTFDHFSTRVWNLPLVSKAEQVLNYF